MRDPNDAKRPLVVLPVRYLDEVKWLPEKRMSFWKHIDKQSILTQIGGPGITEEVALAARQGLNRALAWLTEPLQEACLAAYEREFPSCPDWTVAHPYPLIVKIFASMSARVMVGPDLCSPDHEWQALSMKCVETALSAPGKIKLKYPTWMYWASRYLDDGIKTMWRLRARAGMILEPVLQSRIAAEEERQAQGGSKKNQRKYEDGVQWLYDAHLAHGKVLTPDQLSQDLFVIMTASIHSTSAAGLAMLFDLLEHPEVIPLITDEIARVRSAHSTWSRQALGELRVLDSFMRESARVHALTQYTAVQRIPTSDWTFKDGLKIPAGTTIAFPSYHHGFDPAITPDPTVFDALRHVKKRQEQGKTYRFHFASAGDDILSWGAGRHACPGRFFAQDTLKLMFIHLLTNYEFKNVEEAKANPRFTSRNLFQVPNVALPVMFREKGASQ
jgi:cytochrome P450